MRGPVFSLSDPEPARRLAEQDAVRKALVQARNYAEAMNKRIGRTLRLSERKSYSTETRSDEIIITGSRTARTPVEPGELTTRALIYLDVALVD